MIFLSSDKSAEEMAAYRAAEHGDWLALEHAERAARDALAERYGVGSIPALVVIEQDSGAVVSAEGRREVEEEGVECFEEWRAGTDSAMAA